MEFRIFLEQLIISAGQLSLQFRKDLAGLAVRSKNHTVRDLVSEADENVEHFIRQQIQTQFPQHKIIGEEFGEKLDKTQLQEEYCWLIDPIDGTVNFVKGFTYYSVSITLQHNGQTILAAVYGPALAELYMAERGCGAWHYGVQTSNDSSYQLIEPKRLQEEKPKESPQNQLASSVLITGFGCLRAGIQPNNYLYLGYILPHVSDIRRLGSAALDICLVAAGVYDGFWEIGLNLYDVAAACLILEEAGGKYTDLYGTQKDFPYSVLASAPELHDVLLQLFSQADKPYNGFRSLLQKHK